MSEPNKEQIYDEQISPLMVQIIKICQEKGIAMMADFFIPHDGVDPDGQDCSSLRCTTMLPDETGKHDPLHVAATAFIRRRGAPSPMMIATHHGDGSKTMTAVI